MRLSTQDRTCDAIVVGAGFGGLYMLHKLRNELGMNVRAFDRAGGVGGTWYWNRYPGALSDTEGYLYCYSFDKDLSQEWEWSSRYVKQPEILSYLDHVAERFDLRRSIQFNTGITHAHFDEVANLWDVQTDKGERISAKYLITGLGILSTKHVPAIKGLETFKGERYHTSAWHDGITLRGKRVGVMGTGSTGIQLITAIAPEVRHLTVFQRSPQYIVPARNRPLSEEYITEVKATYGQIWRDVRQSAVAMGFSESQIPAMSVSAEEREAVFQSAWDEGGGFRFMFGTFSDIATDRQANEAAAAFVRSKISEIVKDPVTARKLTPFDLYAKRPLCDSGFYETFNRDNVTLVDLKESPIVEVTPTSVRTADEEHELDALIFATGFDGVDGSYTAIDIRGRGGKAIKDKWHGGPTSYLGVATTDFPNMFMILGPNGPFANIPPAIETQVEWISDLIEHANRQGRKIVEAKPEAESSWTVTCNDIAECTLFPKIDSWIFGVNIPGKARAVMFYLGGLVAYRQKLAEVRDLAYQGFELR
jgi:cyclohexanone monooxygenase